MDNLSPDERSRHMARIRSKDTKPEIILRSTLHKLGYRFRLHRKDLPGTPDIVFPSRKLAIFVHGCFWHGHVSPTCRLGRVPKTRKEFWIPKIEGNRIRDQRKILSLLEAGWNTAVVWECELSDKTGLEQRIRRLLG
ncbi:DNA mismatch endonuclease Vsr [Synechococcus sp. FACHB-909]|uniref:very short patch repair endonuclease n=1 Tax=Synechococcus sp. FACHB-909 TaxID=2692863 RepID=UPI001687DF0E|nr:DNA mismatch endonuclease Vsr [Synechococcus sp. FACHB-909]MBD2719463.1 DNA mismatch endonuclease Vsr [Synechococcus sp. FACHB-909]